MFNLSILNIMLNALKMYLTSWKSKVNSLYCLISSQITIKINKSYSFISNWFNLKINDLFYFIKNWLSPKIYNIYIIILKQLNSQINNLFNLIATWINPKISYLRCFIFTQYKIIITRIKTFILVLINKNRLFNYLQHLYSTFSYIPIWNNISWILNCIKLKLLVFINNLNWIYNYFKYIYIYIKKYIYTIKKTVLFQKLQLIYTPYLQKLSIFTDYFFQFNYIQWAVDSLDNLIDMFFDKVVMFILDWPLIKQKFLNNYLFMFIFKPFFIKYLKDWSIVFKYMWRLYIFPKHITPILQILNTLKKKTYRDRRIILIEINKIRNINYINVFFQLIKLLKNNRLTIYIKRQVKRNPIRNKYIIKNEFNKILIFFNIK